MNRRRMLRNSALSLAALALRPERVLGQMNMAAMLQPAAASPWLDMFADALRIPPVLTPTVRGKTQFYNITLRPGLAKVHRDLPPTPIWGFDGVYPGPTIRATKDQPVVVRFVSQLPNSHGMNPAPTGPMYP